MNIRENCVFLEPQWRIQLDGILTDADDVVSDRNVFPLRRAINKNNHMNDVKISEHL